MTQHAGKDTWTFKYYFLKKYRFPFNCQQFLFRNAMARETVYVKWKGTFTVRVRVTGAMYLRKFLPFQEEPYFPLKEGYSFLESVGEEERVRGSTPPATKEDCEVSWAKRSLGVGVGWLTSLLNIKYTQLTLSLLLIGGCLLQHRRCRSAICRQNATVATLGAEEWLNLLSLLWLKQSWSQ